MSILISVIIPTFNRSRQVVEAIESVLQQTLPPFEILVIDDGSTDDTAAALSVFGEKIRYINVSNNGASSARNHGVRLALGDWIAFLDSDDSWLPEKLARQTQSVSRTGAKVCYCVSMDESGEAIDDLGLMDPALQIGDERFYNAQDFRIFTHKRHPFVQSLLVEKSALLKVGIFDESLRVAEDTKLVYELIYDYGYSVINEKLVRICRDRDGPGLSDTMDAPSAYLRHDCYLRVQSEAYWRLLPIDKFAAEWIKGNMLYFISRQAEIACALHKADVAKRYAVTGLTFGNSWKSIVRNLLIICAYPLAERIFSKKWKTAQDQ